MSSIEINDVGLYTLSHLNIDPATGAIDHFAIGRIPNTVKMTLTTSPIRTLLTNENVFLDLWLCDINGVSSTNMTSLYVSACSELHVDNPMTTWSFIAVVGSFTDLTLYYVNMSHLYL